jgi:hypothetical protein
MSLRNGRTHFFHADATALGGQLERPFAKNIPVQSPTSLPPVGGEAEAANPSFEFLDVLSAKATRARVEGNFLGGLATTRMTSVVEGLNVLNTVRAEQLVAYISSEHPGQEPNVPRISFGRTSITDLRIGDSVLKVQLDLDLLNNGNGKRFPDTHHVWDKNLWKRIGKRFEERGFLKCSLVKKIEVKGRLPGKQVAPNVFEIPDFGRLHVAELLVRHGSYQLVMLRFELGCANQGTLSASAGKVNGGGGP